MTAPDHPETDALGQRISPFGASLDVAIPGGGAYDECGLEQEDFGLREVCIAHRPR